MEQKPDYSREEFEKVEANLQEVSSQIKPEKSDDEILDILSKRIQLSNVRRSLMEQAFDEATNENEIIETEKKIKILSPIQGITKEYVEELKRKIRKLSLEQNHGNVIDKDQKILDEIFPRNEPSRLLDLLERKNKLNDAEIQEVLMIIERLNTLKKEKVVASRLDKVFDLTVNSKVAGIKKISFVKPKESGNSSINIVLYLDGSNNNSERKLITGTFNRLGNLNIPPESKKDLEGVDIEMLREEIVDFLYKFSADKNTHLDNVVSFVPVGKNEEEDPTTPIETPTNREPSGPKAIDDERLEFYVFQENILRTLTSMECFDGYAAFIFKNGIIFDHAVVGNAIYQFEFEKPFTQEEIAKFFEDEYSDDEVNTMLKEKGFYDEIIKTRSERRKEDDTKFVARHPNKDKPSEKEKFYSETGKLQLAINKLSA